ncbi:MAG: hypothetical protein GWO42_10375 [Nitrospinaceae bacterium]|nr:hypothetical protein [Nitrospinaceae bacterium]NIU96635.1 hypothetical protein [Nitrospinaceae bacterium]
MNTTKKLAIELEYSKDGGYTSAGRDYCMTADEEKDVRGTWEKLHLEDFDPIYYKYDCTLLLWEQDWDGDELIDSKIIDSRPLSPVKN